MIELLVLAGFLAAGLAVWFRAQENSKPKRKKLIPIVSRTHFVGDEIHIQVFDELREQVVFDYTGTLTQFIPQNNPNYVGEHTLFVSGRNWSRICLAVDGHPTTHVRINGNQTVKITNQSFDKRQFQPILR